MWRGAELKPSRIWCAGRCAVRGPRQRDNRISGLTRAQAVSGWACLLQAPPNAAKNGVNRENHAVGPFSFAWGCKRGGGRDQRLSLAKSKLTRNTGAPAGSDRNAGEDSASGNSQAAHAYSRRMAFMDSSAWTAELLGLLGQGQETMLRSSQRRNR